MLCPPRGVSGRLLHTLVAAAAIFTVACADASKSPGKSVSAKRKLTPAESIAALSNVSTTWLGNGPPEGHTIGRAESRYALIENDSWGGTREVSSRFQATAEYLVQMTEDNTQLNCSEGIMTRPVVVIWPLHRRTDDPTVFTQFAQGKADTIHVSGTRLRIIVTGPGVATPILESTDAEQGGMGPYENAYYSLSTRQPLFWSQEAPVFVVANGVRRYLGVAGVGSRNALATIAYGTAKGPMQIVRIPSPAGSELEDLINVDSVRIDGPRRDGVITIGSEANDTLPVSGVTIRIHLPSMGVGDYEGDFVAHITNDHVVLDPSSKP